MSVVIKLIREGFEEIVVHWSKILGRARAKSYYSVTEIARVGIHG